MSVTLCVRCLGAGLILGLLSFGFDPRPAEAEPARAESEHSSGYLSLGAENDAFGNGADHDYTHGMAASYATEPCQYQWVGRWTRALGLAPESAAEGCARSRLALSAGMEIFTPTDITRTVPDPADHPYAGWLYLSAALSAEDVRKGGPLATGPVVDRVVQHAELSLGIVGPASMGGSVQREYHQLIAAQQPLGWDYQLKNEPALLIGYDYERHFGARFAKYFEADATPSAGITLGNVFTEASLGLLLRVGQQMLRDDGPPRLRPGFAGGAYFERPEGGIGWYFFAGFEGRAVARNIFLDGNSFVTSRHVEKENFVGDAELGFAVTLGGLRLSYTNVFRSREFSGQPKNDDFGVVTASFQL